MTVKELDVLMSALLKRKVMQAEFHSDGAIKALCFSPMAFEPEQIPIERDTEEPKEPVGKPADPDTLILALRATTSG